jgi:hypothetical protein
MTDRYPEGIDLDFPDNIVRSNSAPSRGIALDPGSAHFLGLAHQLAGVRTDYADKPLGYLGASPHQVSGRSPTTARR